MAPSFPDPDQFPAEFSSGEKAILTAVKGWQEESREVSDAKHAENMARYETLDHEMKALAAVMRAAYPDGDADGHRRYHEAIIKRIEARERFFQELRTELAKKGLWALLLLLGAAVWYYVRNKLAGGGG